MLDEEYEISEESIRHDQLMSLLKKLITAVSNDSKGDEKMMLSLESQNKGIADFLKEIKGYLAAEKKEIKVDIDNNELAKEIEKSNALTQNLITKVEALTEIYSKKAKKLKVVRATGGNIDYVNIEY